MDNRIVSKTGSRPGGAMIAALSSGARGSRPAASRRINARASLLDPSEAPEVASPLTTTQVHEAPSYADL